MAPAIAPDQRIRATRTLPCTRSRRGASEGGHPGWRPDTDHGIVALDPDLVRNLFALAQVQADVVPVIDQLEAGRVQIMGHLVQRLDDGALGVAKTQVPAQASRPLPQARTNVLLGGQAR